MYSSEQRQHQRVRRVAATGMTLVATAAALAGCGSSSSSSSSNVASVSPSGAGHHSVAAPAVFQGATAVDPSYVGPDKTYLKRLAQPTRTGKPFTVGYLQISGVTQTVTAEQAAASAEISALGGKTIVDDAAGSIPTQVAQLKQLLSQHVKAIIAYPIVAPALAAGFKQAAAEHIPVILIGAQSTPTPPDVPDTVTDIDQAVDYSSYEIMKNLAGTLPHGGTFALMGVSVPVPTLEYLVSREQYWGAKLGLKYLGQVPTAMSIAGESVDAKTLLTKYPSAKAFVAINDYGSAALASAQRLSSNKTALVVTPNGGDALSVPLVESGGQESVVRVPWEAIGQQAAIAAYDSVTAQHLPLPKLVQVAGTVVTKQNVKSVPFVN